MDIKITVPTERIQDTLVTAFEGGSNYWYSDLKVVRDVKEPGEMGCHRFHIIPTVKGGVISLRDDEGVKHTLNHTKVQKGLQTLAAKFPQHFADLIAENDDADTGDAFLQCCIFGDVIYG